MVNVALLYVNDLLYPASDPINDELPREIERDDQLV